MTHTGRARRSAAENAGYLPRVLGGMSPIDPDIRPKPGEGKGVLRSSSMAIAVHGFPLDWNSVGSVHEWPQKIDEIQCRHEPCLIWVSEVGVSTFGAEEVQEWGLKPARPNCCTARCRAHPLVQPLRPAARVGGDNATQGGRGFVLLPAFRTWACCDQDGAAERLRPGSFADHVTPVMGLCQWFHYQDHRLDDAVRWMRDLGVTYLRTGLSWADWFRPDCEAWFDRQMRALEEFDVTVTFCFTPEHRGVWPHYTAPPQQPEEFAEFCAAMIRRYAPGRVHREAGLLAI